MLCPLRKKYVHLCVPKLSCKNVHYNFVYDIKIGGQTKYPEIKNCVISLIDKIFLWKCHLE